MDSLVLPQQLPTMALSKSGWKPFCFCPFRGAVPGPLRCEIWLVLDLWVLLGLINISGLCALHPPTSPLTTPLREIMKVWMSVWTNESLIDLHSFQRNVYLNCTLRLSLYNDWICTAWFHYEKVKSCSSVLFNPPAEDVFSKWVALCDSRLSAALDINHCCEQQHLHQVLLYM